MAGILSLHVENFKYVEVVDLEGLEGCVVLNGKNGQGKSSVLDAVEGALRGKKFMDSVPVRVGSDQAVVKMVLGTNPPIELESRIRADGKRELKLSQQIGKVKAVLPGPQSVLDGLISNRLAFDPVAFSRESAANQVKILQELVGVDTGEIDGEISAAMESRKLVNRDVEQLGGQLAGMVEHVGVERVDVSELMGELDRANEHNKGVEEAKAALERESDAIDELASGILDLRQEIIELEERLAALKLDVSRKETEHSDARQAYLLRADSVAAMVVVDTAPIREKISQASEINRKADENRSREAVSVRLKAKEAESSDLTAKIEALRADRLKLMESAKWPVEGLGFGEGGVTFKGLPFSQCSSAQKLRIGAEIAASSGKPDELGIMIIRDGSLLDDEMLGVVREIAEKRGVQVWIERVGAGKPGEILMVEGRSSVIQESVAEKSGQRKLEM